MANPNGTPNIPKEIILSVIEDLNNGIGKKEVANRNKISLGNVYRIANQYKDSIHPVKAPKALKKSTKNNTLVPPTAGDNLAAITTEKTKTMTTTRQKERKSMITDEIRAAVIEDWKNGMTNKGMAEKYGVSTATISRIKSAANAEQKKQDTNKVTNKPQDKIEATGLHKLNRTKYVECGLISDRHDMPVKNYIFETHNDALMFDYDDQYRIAYNNIKSMIRFKDNKPQEGLIVYITGLPCALATVVRVCNDLKINLLLKHFNVYKRCYATQPVFTKFMDTASDDCPSELYNLAEQARSLYTYDCDANKLVKQESFFGISETYYDECKNVDHVDITLFKDCSTAFAEYQTKALALVGCGIKKSVFLNILHIEDGKCYRRHTISMSSCK